MGVEARASSFPLAERQQAAGSWGTFLLPEIPGPVFRPLHRVRKILLDQNMGE